MEKINLCEGVVAQMMETEAWSNISSSFAFNEAQLEKFEDKVDWKNVSSNNSIFWTAAMLEKFKNRIDWTSLSDSLNDDVFSIELIEKFKDKWNWDKLSDSNEITLEFIDRFADYINWKVLVDNWKCDGWATEEFVKKYSDRIPAGEFHNSRLWRELVEKKEKNLQKLICLG